jgi:hypothetical protein
VGDCDGGGTGRFDRKDKWNAWIARIHGRHCRGSGKIERGRLRGGIGVEILNTRVIYLRDRTRTLGRRWAAVFVVGIRRRRKEGGRARGTGETLNANGNIATVIGIIVKWKLEWLLGITLDGHSTQTRALKKGCQIPHKNWNLRRYR